MNGIQGAGWGYGQNTSQTGKTNRSAKADERLKELQEKGLSAEQAAAELEKEEKVDGLRDTYEKSKDGASKGDQAAMRASIVSALTAGDASSNIPSISYSKDYGKVVGDVELSDDAKKVYDELKEKFHGLDFVLVDTDQKDVVSKNAARYGSAGKTTVLIDEEKLEKMASDPNYKQQIISNIETGQKKLEEMMGQVGDNESVTSVGMKINDDGTTSFFATFNKSMKENRERLEAAQQKAKTKKAEADKAAAKRADKKKEAERLEQKKAEAQKAEEDEADDDLEVSEEDILKANEIDWESGDYETIYADTAEELMDKIAAYTSFYYGEKEESTGSFLDIQA